MSGFNHIAHPAFGQILAANDIHELMKVIADVTWDIPENGAESYMTAIGETVHKLKLTIGQQIDVMAKIQDHAQGLLYDTAVDNANILIDSIEGSVPDPTEYSLLQPPTR